MKNKIRVVVWGLGVMGSGIATMVLGKKGFTIVGAIDMDPSKVGKKLYEVLGVEANEDNSCIVTKNAEDVIKKWLCRCLSYGYSFLYKSCIPINKNGCRSWHGYCNNS